MDDPLLVRRLERLGDLFRDGKGFVNGQAGCRVGRRLPPPQRRDPVRERRPLDRLHHNREGGARSLQTIDGRNVRMVQ